MSACSFTGSVTGNEKAMENSWFLYLIQANSGQLYCGVTTNVERRFKEHQEGGAKAARYLRGKGPLNLVYSQAVGSKVRAMQLEYRVKQLRRAKKLQLVKGTLLLSDL